MRYWLVTDKEESNMYWVWKQRSASKTIEEHQTGNNRVLTSWYDTGIDDITSVNLDRRYNDSKRLCHIKEITEEEVIWLLL